MSVSTLVAETLNVLEMLGVTKEDAAMAAAAAKAVHSARGSSDKTSKQAQTYQRVVKQMEEDVKSCIAQGTVEIDPSRHACKFETS